MPKLIWYCVVTKRDKALYCCNLCPIERCIHCDRAWVWKRTILIDDFSDVFNESCEDAWNLRTSQDTTRRHTFYLYVQIPIFHITHLEYSSYTQTLFMGFLLLSEQNTMKLLPKLIWYCVVTKRDKALYCCNLCPIERCMHCDRAWVWKRTILIDDFSDVFNEWR
jgi:predicted metal-binding protein